MQGIALAECKAAAAAELPGGRRSCRAEKRPRQDWRPRAMHLEPSEEALDLQHQVKVHMVGHAKTSSPVRVIRRNEWFPMLAALVCNLRVGRVRDRLEERTPRVAQEVQAEF